MIPHGAILAIAVAFAALGGNCAPTPHHTGEAVVVAWPIVMLLALGPQVVLLAIWRKARPAIDLDLRLFAAWLGLAAFVGLSVAAAADNPWKWLDSAVYLFGMSYVAVLLVATRVVVSTAPKRAVLVPHLVTSVVFVPYAIALYFDVTLGIPSPEGIFIVPGYGGLLAGPIHLALLIEAVIRRIRASREPGDSSLIV